MLNSITLYHEPTVVSTSLMARRAIASGQATARVPMAWIADEQTGGVGRFGRRWFSPSGGVWMTVALPIDGTVRSAMGVRIGLACRGVVAEMVRRAGGVHECQLKWPNDVMLNGRKVLGVLIEVVHGAASGGRASEAWLLVGVGLNANFATDQLPESLRTNATTLRDVLGTDIDLERAAADLLAAIRSAVSDETRPVAEIVRAAQANGGLWGAGREVKLTMPDGERHEGVILGIDDGGYLRVSIGGVERALSAVDQVELLSSEP